MHAFEQMTLLEAGETASSTEIGGQSISWRGQQALAEIPYWKLLEERARLEAPPDDDQEKTGEDETELTGPRTYS